MEAEWGRQKDRRAGAEGGRGENRGKLRRGMVMHGKKFIDALMYKQLGVDDEDCGVCVRLGNNRGW